MDFNRKLAYDILFQIEAKNKYSNIALNNAFKVEKKVNESFVRELVYGTLENSKYLEFVAGKLTATRFKNIHRNVRILIKLGLYQMIFMEGIQNYAAVSESVELCKKIDKRKVSLVNAVLRNYENKKDDIDEALEQLKEIDKLMYLSIKYSFETYIVNTFIDDYGIKRTEAILKALNERPKIYIRANLLKTSRSELMELLKKDGFEVNVVEDSNTALEIRGKNIIESSLYKKGYFSIQDKASQRLIDILDPKPEDKIIDICSAPGGKSFASAERMENKGIVSCRDIYTAKLDNMRADAKRLGIKNIEMKVWNGESIDQQAIKKFNKVICDVPCSGFGVIRKKPEIKYKKVEEELKALPQKQLKILTNASEYVVEEGVIIYSTCTMNKKENQDVVNKFLELKEDFSLVKEVLFTADEDDIDGFYICKLMRGKTC